MPKIFLYASAVLLLLSAGLSFANKGKVTAKNAELAQTKTEITAAQGDVAKAKTAQKQAEKAAAEAATKAADTQGLLATKTSEATDLNAKFDAATKSMAEKDAQIAALNDRVAKLPVAAPGAPPIDVEKQIADLTHERDELKVVKDGLEGQVKSAQAQVASLDHQIKARANGESMNGLRGQVLAVNRDWNFVVLNLGGNRGVNNNATMIIQRGGSLVGRVRITSVDPSQSVADIVPNSVPAGIEVRPGDTVVFSGNN